MHDDNQIFVPPSFMAVFTDARGRLTEKADAVRTRYELCEDLAGHLVEHAQTLYHVQAPSEAEIAGVAMPRPGRTAARAACRARGALNCPNYPEPAGAARCCPAARLRARRLPVSHR